MDTPPSKRLNGEDYAARGPEYEDAWDEIVVGCEIPPSLEVFSYGFGHSVKRRGFHSLTVSRYAEQIVKNYTRIR